MNSMQQKGVPGSSLYSLIFGVMLVPLASTSSTHLQTFQYINKLKADDLFQNFLFAIENVSKRS